MNTRPILDLTRCHFTKAHGDITVFGTWLLQQNGATPALVLLATAKVGNENAIPCIVPLSTAWAWSEEIGDPRHAAQRSYWFAANMGLNAHNIATVMRVTSIIRDHLGDLLSIPPRPHDKVVVADAIRTDQYGKEHHSEVIERV